MGIRSKGFGMPLLRVVGFVACGGLGTGCMGVVFASGATSESLLQHGVDAGE
jgi:hypothetical protein